MSKEELKRAKELLKILKGNGLQKYDVTDEAMNIIAQYAEYSDFIDEYMLDEYTKNELETGGAERLMYFLAQAEPNAPYGYMLDGYGNLRNVELDDIVMALEDVINNEEGK